jgi:hypothetical protein
MANLHTEERADHVQAGPPSQGALVSAPRRRDDRATERPSKEIAMKTLLLGIGVAAALLAAAPASAARICLNVRDITGNYSPDANTIIFHMRDGTDWRNTLVSPCPGLRFDGFVWVLHGTQDVCEGQQSLRVLRSGELCFLGKFQKMPKKVQPPKG